MLIAEDLVLLLTDHRTGDPVVFPRGMIYGPGAAVMVELVLAGRVALADPGRWFRGPRVAVVDPRQLGDPILDMALSRAGGRRQPVGARSLVGTLAPGLLDEVRARLSARGILRPVADRVLGLVPTTIWRTVDPAPRAHLVQRLGEVLAFARPATPRDVAELALLDALEALGPVFRGWPVRGSQLYRRARDLPADPAVRAVAATVRTIATSVD